MLHRITALLLCNLLIVNFGCQKRPEDVFHKYTSSKEQNLEKYYLLHLEPPISLKNIGIMYFKEKDLCCDLPIETIDFSCFVRDTGFNHSDPNLYYQDISKEQKKWLLTHFNLNIGDRWSVIKSNYNKISSIQICDIIWSARETCSSPAIVFEKKDIFDNYEEEKMAYGLAFPGTFKYSNYKKSSISEEIKFKLKSKLREIMLHYRLESVDKIYFGGQHECYLVTFNYGFLRLIRIYNTDLKLIKAKTAAYRIMDDSVVIEDMEEHDLGLWDADVSVVGDLDGDGGEEVYIDSTIPALFSLRVGADGLPVFTEVMTYYCGP